MIKKADTRTAKSWLPEENVSVVWAWEVPHSSGWSARSEVKTSRRRRGERRGGRRWQEVYWGLPCQTVTSIFLASQPTPGESMLTSVTRRKLLCRKTRWDKMCWEASGRRTRLWEPSQAAWPLNISTVTRPEYQVLSAATRKTVHSPTGGSSQSGHYQLLQPNTIIFSLYFTRTSNCSQTMSRTLLSNLVNSILWLSEYSTFNWSVISIEREDIKGLMSYVSQPEHIFLSRQIFLSSVEMLSRW